MATIDILNAKQQRLTKLELRAAIYGIDTPPQVATEIADLHREIAAVAPTSVAESHTILYDLILETRRDLRQLYWMMPTLMILLCGFLVLLVKL